MNVISIRYSPLRYSWIRIRRCAKSSTNNWNNRHYGLNTVFLKMTNPKYVNWSTNQSSQWLGWKGSQDGGAYYRKTIDTKSNIPTRKAIRRDTNCVLCPCGFILMYMPCVKGMCLMIMNGQGGSCGWEIVSSMELWENIENSYSQKDGWALFLRIL